MQEEFILNLAPIGERLVAIEEQLQSLVEQVNRLDATGPGRLLRIEEVAEQIGLSRTRVYELVRHGEIASTKIGRSTRVAARDLKSAVERWQGTDEGGSGRG